MERKDYIVIIIGLILFWILGYFDEYDFFSAIGLLILLWILAWNLILDIDKFLETNQLTKKEDELT